MTALIARARRLVASFLSDCRGVILPYVTLLLIVFVGLATLALDGGRYMTQQTQMQAVADALALAGARELDQRPGAQTRATAAINNLVSNGLTGLGYSGAISHAAPVFYSALPAANSGFTGTAATSDFDSKFVAVTVDPVTIPTVFPIRWVRGGVGTNNFATGARAIAGFTSRAVCDMPPVFICNPYETAGMTDAVATQALYTNLDLASVRRQQVRLDPVKSGPGQFGYLMPPDGCSGANCLEDWIAMAKPKTCYQKIGVDLNTGFKNSVGDGFNVRFDIYNGNLKKDLGNTNYSPALNVRKGYTTTDADWCKANPASPYLNSDPSVTPAVYPNVTTPAAVSGTITFTGNTNCGGKTPSKKCVVANLTSTIVTQVKSWLSARRVTIVSSGYVSPGTEVSTACTTADAAVNGTACSSAGANSLILSQAALQGGSPSNIMVGLKTSGLPMDTSLVGNTNTFGNGQWDCDSYWRINHGTAPPDMSADITGSGGRASGGVCSTPASTTVSRYYVYLYENADAARINQYSLPASSAAGGENGAPRCNGSGVGPSATQTDRRLIYSAVINCLANGPFGGGQTANNIPVAGFAKVFMTQPVGADGSSVIYGELSGLVGSLDEIRVLNQVQLYR